MANFTRRDFLKLGGAAALGLAAARFIPSRDYTEYFEAPLLWHGSRTYHNIAFTYDDCNSLDRMKKLEDLLDGYPGIKVTFFPIGLKITDLNDQDKGIWQRLVDKGHEIGYHSYEHVNLGVMSESGVLEDFDRWQDALNTALAIEYPTHFVRPPYDLITPPLNYLCLQRGLVATMFSVGGGGEPEVVFNGIKKARGGDIVQMHIRKEDLESSQLAFPWLLENGWQLVTMRGLYDVYLREQVNPDGCDVDAATALTRTCVE